MIKRTPQEIADFFGFYVFSSYKGGWFMADIKPELKATGWILPNGGYRLEIKRLVEAPSDHDWTHLYEPCLRNTCEKRMENARITQEPRTNPDHIGEVYTHREYRIESSQEIEPLNNRIATLMGQGWEPCGGVSVRNDTSAMHGAVYYQAMVRGV